MRQWKRILEIHRRLCAGKRFSASSLAAQLEVNERTIRRDLEALHDQYNAPVAYNRRNHTWFYSEKTFELPANLATSADYFAFLIIRQSLEQYTSTPWHEPLKTAFSRMLQSLPDELHTKYRSVAEKIRFEGTPVPVLDRAIWDVVRDCIDESHTVKIVYRSGSTGVVRPRLVDPYGLIVRNREWYIVGWDHDRGAIRTFFVPRIKSADFTDRNFHPKKNFDLSEYLSTAVDGHQSSTRVRRIKLRFTAAASAGGQDFIWNRDQKTTWDRSGRLVVEFVTAALFAVQRNVLSWGGGVEVIAPKKLRDDARRAALAITAILKPM